jgi:hypothetical protein
MQSNHLATLSDRALRLALAVGVCISAGRAAAQTPEPLVGYGWPGTQNDVLGVRAAPTGADAPAGVGAPVGKGPPAGAGVPARPGIRLLPPRFFSCSSDPDDPLRYRGPGIPIQGGSWRNRPLHAGWFVGELYGDALNNRGVDQKQGLFGGYRIGWDFDHYWGTEGRFGFANVKLTDDQSPPRPRTGRDWFWDAHLLYYPWGDAHWRPFASVGLGVASFRFDDQFGRRIEETLFHIPIGLGVKYYYQRWLALRLSVMDNMAIGRSELDTMHNFSITGGVEMRFGGRRTSYYPWNPSMHLW